MKKFVPKIRKQDSFTTCLHLSVFSGLLKKKVIFFKRKLLIKEKMESFKRSLIISKRFFWMFKKIPFFDIL